MRSILFYWGKGADTRVRIILEIERCQKKKKSCYENMIAQKLSLSHVAIKKHLDLLIEEGYVQALNPHGKPVFLNLTRKGNQVAGEFK